jgi:hypothetical protein
MLRETRLVYTHDFVGRDGHHQYGHGEHLAGIIARNGRKSQCSTCTRDFRGMALGTGSRTDDLIASDKGQRYMTAWHGRSGKG